MIISSARIQTFDIQISVIDTVLLLGGI